MGVWLHTEIRPVADATPADLQAWLRPDGDGGRDIRGAGGSIWGLWDGRPGLGLRSDTLLLNTHWADDAAAGGAVELLKSCTLLRGVTGMPLHPTERPVDAEPCRGEGVWVFREFEVDADRAGRFVELSAAAWASFERRFDARIQGLFRGPAPATGRALFLLATRYADLATWEASRSAEADPDAWERFRERHALTHWTRACSAVRLPL